MHFDFKVFTVLSILLLANVEESAARGSTSGPVVAPRSSAYNVLYRFNPTTDGLRPTSLVAVGNALYGTTLAGGTYGKGTVFELSPSGIEQVLYSFKGGADGAAPMSNLTAVGSDVYGTTTAGGGAGCGGSGCGVVFAISSAGIERVAYRFTGGTDGAIPSSGLLLFNGSLYGTTAQGGAFSHGTVYHINPSGVEVVLHSFSGGADGAYPQGGLAVLDGRFFGTTVYSAPNAACGNIGCGTVYSITASGVKSVIYTFKGGQDGANPKGGLLAENGGLYGTTQFGNSIPGVCFSGCGTVFEVYTSGVERVLHRFQPDGVDGLNPQLGLTYQYGALFGTTQNGGGASACANYGCGTVFKLTGSGAESTVYSFQGGNGDNPSALVTLNGALYGATLGLEGSGGTNLGGTIYQVTGLGASVVLHSFRGFVGDGETPLGMVADGAALYGTTMGGGARFGTIFTFDGVNSERVIAKFGGLLQALLPNSGLTYFNGELYGTTCCGSPQDGGTVFAIHPNGSGQVLADFDSFSGITSGVTSFPGATGVYGTTQFGGRNSEGDVFSINSSGIGQIVYSFTGCYANSHDGCEPEGPPTYLNGSLYGTTSDGGADYPHCAFGCGTIYELSLDGKERVIYKFKGGADGLAPSAGLLAVNGLLYGTTFGGGGPNDGTGGGTVFEASPTGTEHVLHLFTGPPDGANVNGPLTYWNGTLYGTTFEGGQFGLGTVFAIDASGTERILYSFQGGTDGANPLAGLVRFRGAFYGTTSQGGYGYGTIFSIRP